jgi:diacylglycerol kinase
MRKFLNSFGYAWNGLIVAVREQLNLKIHFIAALVVVAAGYYFRVTATEWYVLIITMALVISLELINTAIENLVDLVTIERKPLAGKIKDIAAAAVLVASIASAVAGILIFYKYIFDI